jgi:hypothetical protein
MRRPRKTAACSEQPFSTRLFAHVHMLQYVQCSKKIMHVHYIIYTYYYKIYVL